MFQRQILLNAMVLGTAVACAVACTSDSTPSASSVSAKTQPGAGAAKAKASPSAPASGVVGSSGAAGAYSANGMTVGAKGQATAPSPISASCKGFEVLGLKYSPGGSVLPNTCEAFNGTLNNPYAVRCVDADPSYKTAFAGDEYCILPPPPELGTQVHVGPASYDDPGAFALAAGKEINTAYYINSPNAETHAYYRTNWRMRPGSHHMIISVSDTDHADGWADQLGAGGGFAGAMGSRNFGGSQRVDQDRPQGTLDVPPENQGIGAQLSANQQFSFNLHHINTSDAPVLREVWVNIWYMDDKDVTQKMQGLSASGSPQDVAIPAHQRTTLQYKCPITGDTRIISLLGHRHAHTERFGIWVKKASGQMIEAYDSFHWEDMPTYQYDSVSMNPVPDVANKVDGASSGTLTLSAGDELDFECDINNELDQPLKFANETFTGEMCIVFGSYVGASPCGGFAQRVQ